MVKLKVKIEHLKKISKKSVARRPVLQQLPDELSVPLERIFDVVLVYAIEMEATAIHLEWQKQVLSLRFRIGARLATIFKLNSDQAQALKEQISERFRFKFEDRIVWQERSLLYLHNEQEFFLHFSNLETLQGVKQVITLGRPIKTLVQDLNLSNKQKESLKTLLAVGGLVPILARAESLRQHILSSLTEFLNIPAERVVFIGNFLNYETSRCTYLPVKEAIGFSRQVALKAAIRSDFDCLIVDTIHSAGELDYAMAAASAGKLVIVGVAQPDLLTGFHYLWQLPVDHDLLLKALTGFLVAREVPKLCQHCSQPYALNELSEKATQSLFGQVKKISGLKEAIGCPACQNTGRAGSVKLLATTLLNHNIKNKLVGRNKAFHLPELIVAKKSLSLRQVGANLALLGLVNINDIIDLPN
jgi:type II secretory ATPase GspE/PulE/Tfp pilus assembly ATPase PilB-like protein